MKRVWKFVPIAIALLFLSLAPTLRDSLAQQPRSVASANLDIDLPEIIAEVQAAHDRYNDAINSGNIAVINAAFHDDVRTIRYGQADIQHGFGEIVAFRATAQPLVPPRTHSRTVISTYGRDFATASTLTHRANQPGKVGRQMQTWVRFPEGWRIVAAHVSTIDEPIAGK